jgi:hypothetical protein
MSELILPKGEGLTPTDNRALLPQRRKELLEEQQKIDNDAIKAWNAAFSKPKSHRKGKKKCP